MVMKYKAQRIVDESCVSCTEIRNPKNMEDPIVTLLVQETGGRSRKNEPVSFGIPFPRGLTRDSSSLSLFNLAGRECPIQAQPLARWPDGSFKWVLLDFAATVNANTNASYQLRYSTASRSTVPERTLSVSETSEHLIIDTGAAVFFLNRRICKPFDRIVISGKDLLDQQGSSFLLTDDRAQQYVPYTDEIRVEVSGPLRATVLVRGELKRHSHRALARFAVRLHFYAGHKLIQANVTLHNPRAARHAGGLWDLGDEGSIYFKDFSFHVPLRETEGQGEITWTTQPFQEAGMHSGDSVEIYQDSSGGENWRSSNHVNRFGKVMNTFRGYRVTAGDMLVEEGLRAIPIVSIKTNNGAIAGAIEKFWQNFPKGIEADKNGVTFRLFPRQYNDVFELQGGEQKTHTVYLQFCGSGEREPDLSWVHDRLVPRTNPEWYSDSKACMYLSRLSLDEKRECLELINTAIEGPNSFFARREIIDEYGWRNFGDLYADHEAVGHTGDPLVAHYNNQYDVIYGALTQYLRGGDKPWFELASDLARHVIDIDIYHTDKDRPAYNGGLFWHTDHYLDAGTATHRTYSKTNLNCKRSYGGGPSNEHNYTTGLLQYYYLTGDETTREAVVGLADWVINMDNGSLCTLGFVDHRATGLASSTASRDYHGPGRGAGNSINVLLDGYLLSREVQYLDKAEELIRRCIHPSDDIRKRNLDDPEHRWSYLVFLQVLGKYLDIKIDAKQIDFMYHYARVSLLHYADWMLKHEVRYATVLHKVDIPTETWPAQDIRKSVVFDLAGKYASEAARRSFKHRAETFFESCIRDLRSFPTCALTRPVALLMNNAHVHAYFVSNPEEYAPVDTTGLDFGKPASFTAQFSELHRARQKVTQAVVGLADAARSFGSMIHKRLNLSRVQDG
jgi:hypothetical protein